MVAPGDWAVVSTGTSVTATIQLAEFLSDKVSGDKPAEVSQWDHAVMCTHTANGVVYIAEAEPGGARCVPWHYEDRPHMWSTGIIEMPPAAGMYAYQYTQDGPWGKHGVPYSSLDYVALTVHSFHLGDHHLAVPGLEAFIADSHHMICSQLVDRAAQDAGKQLFSDGRWNGYVKPSDLGLLLVRLRTTQREKIMITEAQHEILRDLGKKIASAEGIVRENNARLFEYWWAVGKELENPEYHTGNNRGCISNADKIQICKDLRLSTRIRSDGSPSGSITINKARCLAREFPDGDMHAAYTKYKAWGYYGSSQSGSNAKVPEENRGSGRSRKNPRFAKMGRLSTPFNVRSQVFQPAIEEFMASTGEDEATARACLFGALREMGSEELARLMRQYHENHPLVQSVA